MRHWEHEKAIRLCPWCPSISQPAWSVACTAKGSRIFFFFFFYSSVKKPFGTTLRRHKVRQTPFSEWPKMAALYSAPGGESSQLNVKVRKRHLKILSLVTHVWRCAPQKEGSVLVKESVGRSVGTLGGSPARQ